MAVNILDKIVEFKRQELIRVKTDNPEADLVKSHYFHLKCNSLKTELLRADSSGIIAEFKKKSPSKGDINLDVEAADITKRYVEAGAAGLSVLTDNKYFGGSLTDLVSARNTNPAVPILRKDFIIDEYQVIESKAYGADVILLIAACLDKEQAGILAKSAKDIGMEVLFEIHNSGELDKLNDFVDMVGINNRNLSTFNVDIRTSSELSGLIPGGYVKISESGLKNAGIIHELKKFGFKGFLIGENFMDSEDPGIACKKFISKL